MILTKKCINLKANFWDFLRFIKKIVYETQKIKRNVESEHRFTGNLIKYFNICREVARINSFNNFALCFIVFKN